MLRIDDHTKSNDTIDCEMIDIYKVFSVHNVSSISHIDYSAWTIDTRVPTNSETNHYLAIDTCYDDALAHWVYESAIYLPLFTILKTKYPNLKLHLKREKVYKRLFCAFFGIVDEDIVFEFDSVRASICYMPSPISSLNNVELHPDFVKQVDFFWNAFKLESSSERYVLNVLPRQTRENYKGNDRKTPLNSVIDFAATVPSSIILNTDTINDLRYQMDIVGRSKITVVTDGSPLLLNGMFCYNKHLIVSGDMCTQQQSTKYLKTRYIVDKIIAQNKSVSYIRTEHDTCRKISELMAA
jgi:hypothetical protein